MSILSESELNEIASMALQSKGIDDLNTAYDYAKNLVIALERNAIRLREDTTQESLKNYVRNNAYSAIKDLDRFSPYEMGIFYLEEKGLFHPSQKNSKDVFAQKYGLTAPEEIHGGLLRTIRLGDTVREDFQSQFRSMGLKPDPKSQSALRDIYKEPLKDLPWLKPGMPDLMKDATGKLWMVTFKIPAKQEAFETMSENPPEHTSAEIAQTLIALEKKGLVPDYVVLAPYSIADMEVKPLLISISDSLKSDIIAIGNKMYNEHLLNMTMPKWEGSDDFESIEETEIDPATKKLAGELTFWRAAKSYIDSKEKEVKRRIIPNSEDMPQSKLAPAPGKTGKRRVGQLIQIDQKITEDRDYESIAGFLMSQHDCSMEDISSPKLDKNKIDAVVKDLGLEEQVSTRFTKTTEKQTIRIPARSPHLASAKDMVEMMAGEGFDLFDETHGFSETIKNANKIAEYSGDITKTSESPENLNEKELEEDSTLGLGF